MIRLKDELANPDRTLKIQEINHTIEIIEENRDFLMEAWYGYSNKKNR